MKLGIDTLTILCQLELEALYCAYLNTMKIRQFTHGQHGRGRYLKNIIIEASITSGIDFSVDFTLV